jgi:hypothetical protein
VWDTGGHNLSFGSAGESVGRDELGVKGSHKRWKLVKPRLLISAPE